MGHHVVVPAPPLDLWIERLWDWDMPPAAHRFERVLPSPGAALILNLHEDETRVYSDDDARTCVRSAGAVLGGPCLRSQVIDTAEQVRVMGVVFRPGGAYALTGEDQSTLVGRDIALEDLFGAAARRLRERLLHTPAPLERLALLEQWLRSRVRAASTDPALAYVVDALHRRPQVARIAPLVRETGWSDDRFQRHFRRRLGMGPKRYARLLRFRAVVDEAHASLAIDWSRVAADNGYADQAHLTREFREFAGMTPAVFMAARGPYANHVPLD